MVIAILGAWRRWFNRDFIKQEHIREHWPGNREQTRYSESTSVVRGYISRWTSTKTLMADTPFASQERFE
jgi:hypothetical protein